MSQGRGGLGGNFNHYQNQTQNQSQSSPSSGIQIQLAVKGWASPPSKFAGNPESGINAIVIFLEKKSQRKIISHKVIGKSNILLIDINAADSQRFYHLNGFTFSGAPLTIEESRGRPSQQNSHQPQSRNRTPLGPGQHNIQSPHVPTGPRGGSAPDLFTGASNHNNSNNSQNGFINRQSTPNSGFSHATSKNNHNQNASNQNGSQPISSEKQQLQDLMVRIIRKRYNPELRLLTFAELSKDPDIVGTPLVGSTAAKVWAAFFTVCSNQVFETPAKRREMVESISLANNELAEVKDVIALTATFPQLKNLDLSNNNISKAGDLRFWRNSLRSIEHLVLTNNPIMSNPAEVQKLLRWWGRSLKLFNHQPVSQYQSQCAPGNDGGSMAIDNGTHISPSTTPPPVFAGITSHPEVDVRQFGQPQPGKSEEQVIKERMGLQFSIETHLKMHYVEMCLSANNFDYDKAMANIREVWEKGEIPADAFLG